MTRSTFLAAAMILLGASSSFAAGRPGHGGSGPMHSAGTRSSAPEKFRNARPHMHDYHTRYGQSFSHGFFYKGREHYHWSHYCWWSRFNCYCYWCPSSYCYYYWSEPAGCYYPVSYAETVAPTANVPLLQIANNNNNNVNTSGPSATPATPVPVRVGSELPPPPRE
jgi:hypothetical protein